MSYRLFVGGLSSKVRERDLDKFFRKCGRIREVALKNGFAFVEYDDYRDAEDALYELNGKELCGERISVEKARGTPRSSSSWRGGGGGGGGGGSGRGHSGRSRGRDKYGPPTRTDYRVLVENLSSRVSWQDLKDYMRQAGEVTFADAHKQHRNEGVVEFASYSDMKNALEKLDNTELSGRRIKLVEDRRRGSNRKSRSSSRSRSRSKQRSRSNSRSRSKSRSQSKSRGKSYSRSRSRGRSISRSKSRDRSHSGSKSQQQNDVSNNRSRSRSNDRDNDK